MDYAIVKFKGKLNSRMLKYASPISILQNTQIVSALLSICINNGQIGPESIEEFCDGFIISDMSLFFGSEPLLNGYVFIERFLPNFGDKKPDEKKQYKNTLLTPSQIFALSKGSLSEDVIQMFRINNKNIIEFTSFTRKGRKKEDLFTTREVYLGESEYDGKQIFVGVLIAYNNKDVLNQIKDLEDYGLGGDKTTISNISISIDDLSEEKVINLINNSITTRVALGNFIPEQNYKVIFGRATYYNSIKGNWGLSVLKYGKGSIVNTPNSEIKYGIIGKNYKISSKFTGSDYIFPMKTLSFGIDLRGV
ncbi:MAG: hypothetical protein QXS91_01030 [Candidatus Anstonellales archaeon]